MKICLLFLQIILIVHGKPAAQQSDDPSQRYSNQGNPSGSQAQQPDDQEQQQGNQEQLSENQDHRSADQAQQSENQTVEQENIAEPSQFDDYSFLINPENGNVGSETQQKESVADDDENNVQDSSKIPAVNSGFTSGGRFNGDLVNNRTYYSDTVHDCQRRCQRKRLCSQFNFRKEDGEDDGECTLLRRKTTFEQLPDCHNCKTGPKFSRQSHVGPIVVEKIIAQVSPGFLHGTDDTIKFRFKSGDSECVTRALDDNGRNNWASGTQETHDISCRIENPGQFIQLEASFEMHKWGIVYDRLCLGDFRVTLDDGNEYAYQQELCGDDLNSQWVALQRVL